MPRTLPRTEVRAKGQVTIPAEVREKVHLEVGDPLEVEIVEEGILLRPQKVVDAAQAWFWTERWQRMEREADEDIAVGRVASFDNPEDFFKELEAG